MQVNGYRLKSPSFSAATRIAGVLLAFVSLLAATSASAQTRIVLSQSTQVAPYPSAGGLSGSNPAGSTMGVNQQGLVLFGNSYGNDVLSLNPATGVVTTLGAPGNVGAVAVDAQNNYYFTNLYQTAIVKIPYVGGAYATFNASPTAKCVGNDTAACLVQGLTTGANGYYFGVLSLTFDAAGDLFFGLTNGNTAPNAIFECTAACTTGNGAATLLYQEPANAAAQLTIGGMIVDAYGNLFFTDSAENSSGVSTSSNVNELVYTVGAGYATKPLVLYTYTPTATSTAGDQITSVNVDASGNVYFATLFDGIFAFPANKGVVTTTALYAVSTQGAKVMATDGKGNFYEDVNLTTGDVMDLTTVGTVTAPSVNLGMSSQTAGVTTLLNDGACTSSAVTFISSLSDFVANTTGSTCATLLGKFGSFATNITFTPTAGGTRTSTLTATDTAGSTGTGIAIGKAVAPTAATPTFSPVAGTYTATQTVAISDTTSGASIYYTTNGTTPTTASTLYTAPITVATTETIQAIAAASSLTTSAVASATYTITPPAATPTISPAGGTYTSAQTVTLSDTTSGAAIYYTIDGTTPTTASTLYTAPIAVATSETIKAIALGTGYSTSATASATYVINIATTNVKLPTVLSQLTQVAPYPSAGGLSGSNPAGSTMGVNQQGLVLFGNSYGNDVLSLNPATGVVTTLGAPGNVGAVAVDAQNNYYFTNLYQTAIVKIPYVGGAYATFNASPTAKCVGNDTAACLVQGLTTGANGYYFGVLSLTFDAAGDLFFGLTNGNTAPNAIFECTAACTTGNGAATLLYQEPANAAAQLTIGGMIVDAYGNLFFTDSAENSSGVSTSSNVNELVYTVGAGYATKPLVLYTYTPTATSTAGDQITSVNVDASGNVYFATLFDGIFAFPANKGVVTTTALYAVSTQGAKVMATDGKGNFYEDVNLTTGDVMDLTTVGSLTAPAAQVGKTSSATNVITLLNSSTCTTSPTVSFAAAKSGVATTEFSAATSGACTAATIGTGGSFPTTLTFTPAAAGTRTATLTATDANKNTGTAAVSAIASTQPSAATPTFSVPGGTYTSVQTVTLADTTTGASIYYTTNGSTPTTASTLYTGAITVSSSETIEAIATAAGDLNSAVATVVYVINLPVTASPTFSPVAGTYTSAQKVTLSSTSTSAAIYYTLDGSTPSTSSTLYTAPINIAVTTAINAIATASGSTPSTVSTATFTINPPAATPTISVAAGTYTSVQSVTLADTTPSASIYYTLDGSAPTTSSTLYAGPISVGVSETLKAIATANNFSVSPVASAAYVINLPAAAPTFTPAAGTYTSVQSVALSSTTAGASIYYTVDGSAPTPSSTPYTGPITVGLSETVKAVAIATGSSVSSASSAAYVITLPPAAPTFSVAAGTYSSVQTVSLATVAPGSTIYFTINGTAPTTASALYSAPIQVGVSETLEAIAVNANGTSAVTTAAYVIDLPAPALGMAITPGSLTLTAGQAGTLMVTLTPSGGFNSTVAFSCIGLPSDAGCTFSPASPVISGSPSTTTLTVSTTTNTAALHPAPSPFLPAAGIIASCCLVLFRKRRRLRVLLTLAVCALGFSLITGCGSATQPFVQHIPSTSIVQVTATAGIVKTSTNFTLIVQ